MVRETAKRPKEGNTAGSFPHWCPCISDILQYIISGLALGQRNIFEHAKDTFSCQL